MSDDEEYDEWEEEYLFEDLVPDLVDDLAQSSYYEAALYEDPGADVEEYFSDWEYYSDDYYDDDPSVKQMASNPPPAKKARRALAQTGPKANANANANRVTRPKTSMDPDISSFQGVVWKTPALDINQDVAIFYEPIGDKVALLKDWREIFKSAQPALNKSRLRKRKVIEDEGEDDENAMAEVSFADDEFPCDNDDERRLDSSEQMSDIISMDNSMTDTVDHGDASNTTPELGQSPKPIHMPTSTPAKRGRKRKAEVVADEVGKGNSGTDSVRNRSKRVAGKKGDSEATVTSATSAPTRRSTRQKK